MTLVQQNIKSLTIPLANFKTLEDASRAYNNLANVLNKILVYTLDKNYQILTDEFNELNQMTHEFLLGE